MTSTAHPFAFLAAGPYTFVRYQESVYQACQDAPVQPGTSCDVCLTGIRHVFWFKGSDGRMFKTGSDCALKAGREYHRACRVGRITAMRTAREAGAAAKRAAQKAAREAEIAATVAAIRAEHPEWVEAIDAMRDADGFAGQIAGEFENTISRGWALTEKQAALLARLYEEHTAPKSAHVGEVGKRLTLRVKLARITGFDTRFGFKTVYIFRAECGARVVWKTTSPVWGVHAEHVGSWYDLTATIGAHGEREGVAQTEVKRAKLAAVGEQVEALEALDAA